VYITGPKAGATVAGTAWVDVWVEQATGTSTFALSVDGVAVTQQQTTGAHVTLAWPTGGFGNGSHAVRVTVTDGSGKTGTGQVTVTVNN
jgi:hypothetical protein